MNMIRDMINKLEEESAAEAGKNGMCMQLMSQNKLDIEEATAEKDKAMASVEGLTAAIGENKQRISTLQKERQAATKMLSEATKVRNESKKAHEDAIAESQTGADACGQAITVLKDFYAAAADAQSFAQVD